MKTNEQGIADVTLYASDGNSSCEFVMRYHEAAGGFRFHRQTESGGIDAERVVGGAGELIDDEEELREAVEEKFNARDGCDYTVEII